MRLVGISKLLVVGSLVVCGCNREPTTPINPDAVDTSELSDILLPKGAPQFFVFDFGLAEMDEEDADKVLFGRSLFESRQVTKKDTFDVPRLATVQREITDDAGKKQVVVEEIETLETRFREYSTTVYEVIGDQILSCPLRSLTAFDCDGSKLSAEHIRSALVDGRRVVLRTTDEPEDPFYGGFFDADILFVHSNEWVDIDYVPEPAHVPATAPTPEPEVRVSNKPLITDLAIAY